MESHCHDEDFGTSVSLGTDILQKSFFWLLKTGHLPYPPHFQVSSPSKSFGSSLNKIVLRKLHPGQLSILEK